MAIPEYVDISFVKNLSNELLNAVSKYNKRGIEYDDIRLYQRKTLIFRDIIDSVLPSMLIIDYDNIRKELSKYNDIVSSLKDLLGTDYEVKSSESFDYTKLSKEEIELFIDAIKAAENSLNAKSVAIKTSELQSRLNAIVTSNDTEATVLKKAKNIFNKIYRLMDSSSNKPVYIFPSFSILQGQLTSALDIGLSIATIEKENFRFGSIGELLDFGHTAVGYQEKDQLKIKFNSPKLFGILYDVLTSTNVSNPELLAKTASVKFLEETKQVEEYIEIDKEFSDGFIKLFVSIGGNIVRFENSILNQRRGSILERKETLGTGRVVLQRLKDQFKGIGKKLATEISRSIVIGRDSPSILDYIKYSIITTIEGKTVQRYNNKKTVKNSTTYKTKMPVLSGIGTPAKLTKKSKPRSDLRSNIVVTNLTSLQNLLNASLIEQVKKNMGTGSRRDILNLRTGRFAESVEITRMSESRQGMITAFYTYMKNPYATFSAGGRQEYPRSRDPKLLIAKSIREIAAQQVGNRLRSVLV